MNVFFLIVVLFTNDGTVLSQNTMETFKDADSCLSYVADVQNQVVATLPVKLQKAVGTGDVHLRAVCTEGLTL